MVVQAIIALMHILLLFGLSFFSIFANCPEYNLYSDQSYFSEMPIVDQGRTGMCYAISASQAMNYHLKQNGDDKIVSPFWLALNHKKKNGKLHWNPDSMNFSLLSWSYADYLASNHCDKSLAEGYLQDLSKEVKLSPYNIIETFELIWDFSKKNINFNMKSFMSFVNKKHKNKLKLKESQVNYILNRYSSLSSHKTLMSFFNKHFFNECHESKDKINTLPSEINKKARGLASYKKQETRLLNILDSVQDKPIVIGYCANILKYPGYRVPNRPAGLSLVASKKCYAHYSLIVGSRQNKNSCEVLIRNSYGEKFWADKTYSCLCENRFSGKIFNCTQDKFNIQKEKVLGCWLPSHDLAANTFELNYL